MARVLPPKRSTVKHTIASKELPLIALSFLLTKNYQTFLPFSLCVTKIMHNTNNLHINQVQEWWQ